jgi:hypothetical protein
LKLKQYILAAVVLVAANLSWAAAAPFDVICMGSCPFGHSKLDFYDEDTMSSNDQYGICSCQSIKAYTDALQTNVFNGGTVTGNWYVSGVLRGNTVQIGDTVLTTTAAEANELHGAGAVTADFAKLHAVTSGSTELNKLDGTDAVVQDFNTLHDSAPELHELDGAGVVTADFVKLHAITSGSTELSELHSAGADNADFVKLAAVTSGSTELNKLDGTDATTLDFNTLHDTAPEIKELDGAGAVNADFVKLHAVTLTAAELNTAFHNHAQSGVMSVDFTGVCADAERVNITYGSTEYNMEFDTGGACTAGAECCMDASGDNSAAACGTLLTACINGVTIETKLDALLETDIVHIVDNSGDVVNYTATETGGNISLSNAAAIGEIAASVHRIYHCDLAVSANEKAQLQGATGTMALCVISTTAPHFLQCSIHASDGTEVKLPNTSVDYIQVNSNVYLIILRDTGAGLGDLDQGDNVHCEAWDHEL